MNKYINMMMCLAICTLMLAGCGAAKVPEEIDTTTISVNKEGKVTYYLVGDFDKDYYNVSELTSMAIEDASVYNEQHKDDDSYPIVVKKVSMLSDNARVMVHYEYDEDEDFAGHNEGVMFYGTVEDALEEGYNLAVPLTSVKDGTLATQEDLSKNPEKSYVLITDAKAAVYCPKKVTHIGEGAVYQEDGSVDTTACDGVVVMLMK